MTAPSPVPRSTNQHQAIHASEPAASDHEINSEVLISLLRKQLDSYKQLHELSNQQAQLVTQGHPGQLLEVLAKRQSLVDALTQINGELQPYRHQWKKVLSTLSPHEHQQVRQLVTQVETLLADIIKQDNHDRQQLELSKGLVADALSKTTQASAAMTAYKSQSTIGNNRLAKREG